MTTTAKVPANVVRCVKCNGPIKHEHYRPYQCADCGRNIHPEDGLIKSGYHWEIDRRGWLTSVETVDDERDTEEEIADLYEALRTIASILGDGMTAMHVGGHFACSEADSIAQALSVGNQKNSAINFLEGHALGDDDENDIHHGESFDADEYVRYELLGEERPEPESEARPTPGSFTEELLQARESLAKLLNLN